MMIRPATGEITERLSSSGAILPDGKGGFMPCPPVMTEEELIRFLRIPEVTNAGNHHNVVENLKRTRGLPRVHLCGKALYPLEAVTRWIDENTAFGK